MLRHIFFKRRLLQEDCDAEERSPFRTARSLRSMVRTARALGLPVCAMNSSSLANSSSVFVLLMHFVLARRLDIADANAAFAVEMFDLGLLNCFQCHPRAASCCQLLPIERWQFF